MYNRFILLFFATIIYMQIEAQSVSLVGVGVSGGPSFGNRITKNRNDNQVTPYPGYKVGYQKLNDSLDKVDSYRAGYDIGINAFFNTFSRIYFSVGFGYRNTGYRRRFENLKFRDSIQYMGSIDVFSDNGSKDITFNFRYHYIDIPVLFHYSLKKREDQYGDENHFITFGVAPNFLLRNDFRARLFGFSIEEQVNFKGKDIYYQNQMFNMNVLLGGRFQISADENWRFNITPLFSFPLRSQTSATDGTMVRPYTISLNAGLTYKIQ